MEVILGILLLVIGVLMLIAIGVDLGNGDGGFDTFSSLLITAILVWSGVILIMPNKCDDLCEETVVFECPHTRVTTYPLNDEAR
jgi:hypothetical protein